MPRTATELLAAAIEGAIRIIEAQAGQIKELTEEMRRLRYRVEDLEREARNRNSEVQP